MIVYKGRLLKKSLNRKLKLVQSTVNAGHYMTFKHISHLICDRSESRLTSFPSFCAPPSEVAVLFDSNLSRRPFFGQVVNLDQMIKFHFSSHRPLFSKPDLFSPNPSPPRDLSFGATLELFGIWYRAGWSVGVPAIINETVFCLGARKMQCFT